jgi:hypothetical protein
LIQLLGLKDSVQWLTGRCCMIQSESKPSNGVSGKTTGHVILFWNIFIGHQHCRTKISFIYTVEIIEMSYIVFLILCIILHQCGIIVLPVRLVFILIWVIVMPLMSFNALFNNMSAISWRSVLLVEETGVPRENHRPVANQTNFNIYMIMWSCSGNMPKYYPGLRDILPDPENNMSSRPG